MRTAADPISLPAEGIVEQTDTIKGFGPQVGGFVFLVLAVIAIKRKWPKPKTKPQEQVAFHETIRQGNQQAHETIRSLHGEQQQTLRVMLSGFTELGHRVDRALAARAERPVQTEGDTTCGKKD